MAADTPAERSIRNLSVALTWRHATLSLDPSRGVHRYVLSVANRLKEEHVKLNSILDAAAELIRDVREDGENSMSGIDECFAQVLHSLERQLIRIDSLRRHLDSLVLLIMEQEGSQAARGG